MVVFEGEYVAGEGYTLQRAAGAVPTRWFGEGVPRGATQYTWEQMWNAPTTDVAAELIATDPVAGEIVWNVEFPVRQPGLDFGDGHRSRLPGQPRHRRVPCL